VVQQGGDFTGRGLARTQALDSDASAVSVPACEGVLAGLVDPVGQAHLHADVLACAEGGRGTSVLRFEVEGDGVWGLPGSVGHAPGSPDVASGGSALVVE